MSALWPNVVTDRDLDEFKNRTSELLPGVRLIAARHGPETEPIQHVQNGSLPVFFIGDDRVLKLYPPRDFEGHAIETRTLEFLHGKLAAPQVIATGDVAGWRYLLMTRLRGRSLETAWDEIGEDQRLRLAETIGRWLRDLHSLPLGDLELEHPFGRWPEFLDGRYAIATEEQARFGLAAPWLEQVAPFLESVDVARHGRMVLLHTEVMRAHIFVDQHAGSWGLAGLLDFEPAMIGTPEYELASVGVFTSCGEPQFLRRLLLAYGYTAADLNHDLQRRCMAYTLLHRYTCLPWYLRRMPPEAGVESLDQLAAQWWRFE